MRTALLILALAQFILSAAHAQETLCVKYHKCVPMAAFDCRDEVSSVVHRSCYLAKQKYLVLVIGNQKTAYHWCDVPQGVVDALRSAPSKGRYFNQNIVGRATGGRYDCRNFSPPAL